jgi:hypothetical protein
MRELRMEMGFARLPAQPDAASTVVGAVRLSEAELRQYREYVNQTNAIVEMQANKPSVSVVLQSMPEVLSVAFSGSVLAPRLDVYLSSDAEAKTESKILATIPQESRTMVRFQKRSYNKSEIEKFVAALEADLAVSPAERTEKGSLLAGLEKVEGVRVHSGAYGGSSDGVVLTHPKQSLSRSGRRVLARS